MGPRSRLLPVLFFAVTAASSSNLTAESAVVGGDFEYTVLRGDSLTAIGARFAVSPESIAARNGLARKKRLVPGQLLRVDNRHIVPAVLENGILINIPQRLLFYFENGHLSAWYPVAVGQPGSWQTPTGSYRVVTKEKDPVWDVPVSIQREMRRKGERVRTKVPPGPDNPLGEYWLGLSLDCCGIHSTNAAQSIYTFQTHGCIRLAPESAVDLFARVSKGVPVEIVYEPVLVARDDYGATYVEVHPDVYGYGRTDALVAESPRWEELLRRQEGIATRLVPSRARFEERSADRIRAPAAEVGE